MPAKNSAGDNGQTTPAGYASVHRSAALGDHAHDLAWRALDAAGPQAVAFGTPATDGSGWQAGVLTLRGASATAPVARRRPMLIG